MTTLILNCGTPTDGASIIVWSSDPRFAVGERVTLSVRTAGGKAALSLQGRVSAAVMNPRRDLDHPHLLTLDLNEPLHPERRGVLTEMTAPHTHWEDGL